jgi:lysyl-tRNA synthetase, class II
MRITLDSDSPWVPRLASLLTFLAGLVNVASALRPDIRWRGHLLLRVEALETMKVFHALALPAGAALLLVSPYLLGRRRRAMRTAITLLIALGFVNLLKGLDFEECLVSWGSAGLLYVGRRSFTVLHAPITLRSAIWRVPAIGLSGIALVTLADWVTHGGAKFGKVVGESGALLRFHRGSLQFENHTAGAFDHAVRFAWIPLATHFVEIGTLLAIAYVIFRPLAAPRALPAPAIRRRVVEVVRRHGRDTLSFFKLRPDYQYFFSRDRSAFVGYRIQTGVLLLGGDPVGPSDRFPGLLAQVHAFAGSRGLRLGALGASEALIPLYKQLGLQTMYFGDEAIVEAGGFTLQGRASRKVRQSVARLTKAGYTSELHTLDSFDPDTLAQVERVLEAGLFGAADKSFSMAMDGIRGACDRDTLFVLARDGEQRVRAVLHFVPCYGRKAVSLSLMRRDPDTPNGLMEFLVVESISRLKDRGIDDMSLNFATGARWVHDPHNPLERVVGAVVKRLDGYFQMESLYRFNVKFGPRWEPRYLVFEGWLQLPRAGLAALWLEGWLPKPSLPRIAVRRPRQRKPATAAG